MQFNIEHDWQENMSTPRAKVGEQAKTHLLILLCTIWLCFGLVGHAPWRPFESQAMSIIQSLLQTPLFESQHWLSGAWVAPIAISQTTLETPPLFYWVATIFAKLLAPILTAHDAARLSIGFWMLVTLLMIGMSGRELWGKGVGRQSNFIFIGCLGLVVSAHTIMPAIATLAGLSTAFYGFTLTKRKPQRASLFISLGLLLAFLAGGILPGLIVVTVALALMAFPNWRVAKIRSSIILGLCMALPLVIIWCVLCQAWAPILFASWWQLPLHYAEESKHLYLMRTLAWYAWPALPIAAWGVWRFHTQFLRQPTFQLCSVFLIVAFVLIGFFAERHESTALPMLIPLTALAAGSIETLKRGAAGALNWFGLILFGLLIMIAWLGWWAMLSGTPHKLYLRLSYLSGLPKLNVDILSCIIAVAVTLIWLSTVIRSKHSNRSSATNWAIGMTCAWALFMTLWLPIIEAARSYQTVFESLKKALPENYSCISSRNLGSAHLDLLYYHANVKTYPTQGTQVFNCDLMLIESTSDMQTGLETIGTDWTLVWQGQQGRTGRDLFKLYQKVASQ
jgi:4-amino-4-deoxy-L-arabinose transferase-like glycosyltransferase